MSTYGVRFCFPNDLTKENIENQTAFTSYRTITDKDGNSYNLIDVIGWKSKTDDETDFTDWTADNSVYYTNYLQSTTENPITGVLYIREKYRDIFKFTKDILPIYLYYMPTGGTKEAIPSIYGTSETRFYYFHNEDSEATEYIQGTLQDNGYEYYFHWGWDAARVSGSNSYLPAIFCSDTNYFELNGNTYPYTIGLSNYAITTNNTDERLESYIGAIGESGETEETEYFTLNVEGENFTADNSTEYESGENVTVTITPNDSYNISSVSCDDATAVITENENGSYTITFTISQNTTITVETAEETTEIEYLTVKTDYTNCSFKYYDEYNNELSESEIETKKYLKIVCTANNGYYFATAPRIVERDTIASETDYNFSIAENNPDNNFPTIYTHIIEAPTGENYVIRISLYAYGTLQQSDFEGYGCCSFYLVNREQLKTIADTREKIKTLDYTYILSDMGDYISTLACIYMNVVGSGETETLLLGGYSTGLEVEKITNLFQYVDCGNFTIDEIFNNAYDYENVSIRAYLPFYGFVELETVKYMNKTTHLYYKVFTQTGDSLIIFEDSDNNILDTFNCSIAYDIPYLIKGETFDTNATKINVNLLYGFQPFIEISYNNEVNSIDTKGYNDEVVTIGDLKGFVKCEEIFNTVKTSMQERELINTLLKTGILI